MLHTYRYFSLVFLAGSLALLGTENPILGQAGSSIDQDQNAALQAVAKMTEGQRTYYQRVSHYRCTSVYKRV
jgi:hypothetical protein